MQKHILLIISGGIAAYKVLDMIRTLKREADVTIRTILTKGGEQFVTPLSVSALTGEKTYTQLWSLTDEQEMGHINLVRQADLVVIAPASADFMARCALGLGNDLASTCILANQAPVLCAPAMNPAMWENPATQGHVETLHQRGWQFIGPDNGDMACGETGTGRMTEPEAIADAIVTQLDQTPVKPLAGKTALVTSGPTYEAIDPVRFIGNRSSGKQGHAIAAQLARLGASVRLVTGPVALPDPTGVDVVPIETADEMLEACMAKAPYDMAVCAAAVADWRMQETSLQKLKKNGTLPSLALTQTPDILKTLSDPNNRKASTIIGFSLESENVMANAKAKLHAKGCDALIVNSVSGETSPFANDENHVIWLDKDGDEDWGPLPKSEIAAKIADKLMMTPDTKKVSVL